MNTRSADSVPAGQAAAWYLVQCKPRQDPRAEEHLLRQGYSCYRPLHRCERRVRNRRRIFLESLFPGYLFIHMASDANWAPLRSTHGVSRVVAFGGQPLPVADSLIARLQQRTATDAAAPVLETGARVRIIQGSLAELDAVFIGMKGEERVLLLLNLLHRPQQVCLPLASIARA